MPDKVLEVHDEASLRAIPMRHALRFTAAVLAAISLASIASAEANPRSAVVAKDQNFNNAAVEKVGWRRRRARRCYLYGDCPPVYGYYPPTVYVPAPAYVPPRAYVRPPAYVPPPAYVYPPRVYTRPYYRSYPRRYW